MEIRTQKGRGATPLRGAAGLLALVAVLSLGAGPAPAQTSGEVDVPERARRLVEQGAYERATVLLAGYLEQHPGRARVRWLRARTLYWQGRPAAARREYGRALEDLPENAALRVDFGRMLAETGRLERAREVLDPAPRQAERPTTEADARLLLGKLAYWSGDHGGARRHLSAALRIDPARPEGRRILTEIQRMSAPWLALGAGYRDDSQPLQRRSLTLEAGVPLSPRVELSARATPRQLAAGADRWRSVRAASAAVGVDWPGPLAARVEAGRLRHAAAGRAGWTGEGELTARLAGGLSLAGTAERWSYRYTTAVLDTALFVESAAVRLRRERPTGWGGRLGGRVDRFPGGNRVRSAHLWLLAPVWSGGGDALRLGYAFRAADAERSTFRPTDPGSTSLSAAPGPPFGGGGPTGGGSTAVDGVYRPYYTPEDVRSHSAVAALQVRAGPDVLLSADGAVGVHATEQAPRAATGGGVTYVQRDFRPWRLRGRIRVEPARGTELALGAEYHEDAFFRAFEASVRWTYRFLGALPGR